MIISDSTPAEAGLYMIVNLVNARFYVGSTREGLKKRALHHRRELLMGLHKNRHLQHAFNKYGAQSFLFLPFLFCHPDETCSLEQTALDANAGKPFCYNLERIVGRPMQNRRHSRRTRNRIGLANALALKGKRVPEHTRARLRDALRQYYRLHPRVISEESKRRMALAKLGKSAPWNAHPKSESAKRKISETKTGYRFTDAEWSDYRNMGETRRGKWLRARRFAEFRVQWEKRDSNVAAFGH